MASNMDRRKKKRVKKKMMRGAKPPPMSKKKKNKQTKRQETDKRSKGHNDHVLQIDTEWSDDNTFDSAIERISNRHASASGSESTMDRSAEYSRATYTTTRARKKRKLNRRRGRAHSEVMSSDNLSIGDYDSYYDGKKRRRSSRLMRKKRVSYS